MTLPGPLSVGDLITAAWLNLIRSWAVGVGVWTDYTPVLTADTTNPNLGNGAAYGRFMQVNGLVIDTAIVRFGTSGTSAGSGNYFLSLPITPSPGLGSAGVDGATLIGSGIVVITNHWTPIQCELFPSDTRCHLRYLTAAVSGSVVNVDDSHPNAWGTGGTPNDSLRVYRTYQAA